MKGEDVAGPSDMVSGDIKMDEVDEEDDDEDEDMEEVS